MSKSTGWWTKLKEEYNIETDQSGAVKTNTSRSGGSSPAGSGNRASGDGSAQAGGWWSNLKKEYNIDANLRAAEITDYAKDLGRYVGAATGYAGAKVAGGVMGGMVHGQSDPAPKTEQKAAPRGEARPLISAPCRTTRKRTPTRRIISKKQKTLPTTDGTKTQPIG